MKLKYFTWLPAAIIIVLIFLFSHKPADNSNESSLTVANKVLTIYETITDHPYDKVKRLNLLENINHIVRKGAHFTEYALLAFALAFHFCVCKWSKFKIFSLSAVVASIYAMTDEYHQTFIEGRSGQIRDVMIDASGAVTGALCFLLLTTLIMKFSGKNTKL